MQDFTNTCMIWSILILSATGIGSFCANAQAAVPQAGVSQPVVPQPTELHFKHLTVDDGLSHITVYTVYQDSRGYMWFGTQDGLNRYDGYEFKVYKNEVGNPQIIDDNWITQIYEDREGTLWICTSGGGFNRYDFETDTFTPFMNVEGPERIEVSVVRAMAEDMDNNLWLSTNAGVYRFNKATETYIHYVHQSERIGSLSDNATRYIYADQSGRIWVGTESGGLNRYDRETDSFYAYQHDPADQNSLSNNYVVHVLEDHEGTFWVATLNGLNRYDPSIDGFEKFFHDPKSVGSLSHSDVRVLFEDSKDNFWIGTYDGGLNRYNWTTGKFEHFKNNPARAESLSNDKVRSIYEDHAGVLWLGTEHGVNYVDLEAGYFNHYKHDPSIDSSLSDNSVKAIASDPLFPETLWIGTEVGGLNKLNVVTGRVEHFQHQPGDPTGLDHNYVVSLLVDYEGTLWVGTREGINRFDRKTQTFKHVLNDHPNSLYRRMRIIYEASSEPGILWVSAGFGGLVRYEVDTDTYTRHQNDPADEYSLSDNWITAIYEDKQQQLWIGTFEGGLNRFDRSTQAFSRYQYDSSMPLSLKSREVNAIGESADGLLWLATGNGLARFDVDEGVFKHYTEQNSDISSNSVYGLLIDDRGFIWLSTLAGISKFDPQTEMFENFDVELGLQGRAFNLFAYHKDKNGVLYFGGPNGFNSFQPDEIKGNPHPPKLVLTDFKLFDQRVTPGDGAPLETHISAASQIKLSHNQNDISIEYVGLHYSSSNKNQYVFKLENYDRKWRTAGKQRIATYTSLNPGKYTFKVKAANANGVWMEEEKGIDIIVAFPWWRRTWAYMMFAAILGLVLFSVDKIQRARLLNKEREAAQMREAELRAKAAELKSQAAQTQARLLEAENERKEIELQKAAQLKDAYDALQDSMDQLQRTQQQLVQAEKMASLGQLTAGIAHEIKNPLNFVVNFASVSKNLMEEISSMLSKDDSLLEEETQEEMKEMLSLLMVNTERINEHGLRADSIVKSMMEHSRPSDGTLVNTQLSGILHQAIDLAYNGLKNELGVEIEIERDFDESLGEVKLLPQDFTRVIINILDNAFYAIQEAAAARDDHYAPHIRLSAGKELEYVVIRIEDNGAGMSGEVKTKIFEPFYTTKPTGAGNTGLGLSLSYDIIAQGHHGAMQVDSTEGEGTTFIIRIPA